MKTTAVSLPSGLGLTLRAVSLAEESIFAEAARSKGGHNVFVQALYKVLSACSPSVNNPGPYPALATGGRADWAKMLLGDRIAAMLHLRALSYRDGNIYTLEKVPCPACRERKTHTVDIFEQLVWAPLSPESAERFRAGQPFEVEIQDRKVSFGLGTGLTEELSDKLDRQNPGRIVATSMRARILDVEGIDRRDILDWLDGCAGRGGKFEGLSSQEADDLRDAFDRADCGVDTDVELTCRCGNEFVMQLPFGEGFFAPAEAIKARRAERRLGKDASGS
jgi:hypothetical protein